MNILELKYKMNIGIYSKLQTDYKEQKVIKLKNMVNKEFKLETFDKSIIKEIQDSTDFCIYFLFITQNEIDDLEKFYSLAYSFESKEIENKLREKAYLTFMQYYNPLGLVQALKLMSEKHIKAK